MRHRLAHRDTEYGTVTETVTRPSTAPTKRERRICIATSIHPDYDARVFRHARAVAEVGFDVDLVCPWGSPRFPLPPKLRIVRFPRVTQRAKRPILVPARMLPLLLAKGYDLYHFHDLDLLPSMVLVKLVTRRPVIYDCHENYPDEMMSRPYRIPAWSRKALAWGVGWSERFAAAALREVVIVVPQQRARFPAPWFRTTVVQNFAELSLENGRSSDLETREDACISTASQYVSNGALLFVDVAREVVRRRPHVKFYAVDRFGNDLALRDELLRRVAEANLEANFKLLPNVAPPSIMTNLNQATIGLSLDLATPNRLGALPIKLFEYMAAGIPIVAADLPNIRQVVDQAGNGLLATPGDPISFADKICLLIDDRQRRLELGRRGLLAFRDRFNWESEVKKTIELYERLLRAS